MSSVIIAGDASGTVTLQAPSAAGSTVIDLPATSGTMAVLPTATSVLPEASGGTGTTTGYYGFKNRIINGAMMIDQRNAGASVTVGASTAVYAVDRFVAFATQASKFSVQQNAGAVTPPAGYKNYLGVTSLSAYSVGTGDIFELYQPIEGLNVADLGFGAAGAATVTLSFWVRSSLTGTFGGSLTNATNNRNYPFTYTISAANTWEQKSVTVAGDTTGTWLTTNAIGLTVIFGLGAGSTYGGATANTWNGTTSAILPTGATSVVGTNGATFYITGVQLEKGSTATSFDYRPYGTELALCQRYFQSYVTGGNINGMQGYVSAYGSAGANWYGTCSFVVSMRENPTMTKVGTWSATNCGQPTLAALGNSGFRIAFAITATGAALSASNSSGLGWTADAEL